MARIIGNLSEHDSYTHPVGPERNFNESMYFNFFDRQNRIGGFLRIGNRANEGHGEMTVSLFRLGDGHVLFSYQREAIGGNESLDVAGFRVDILEPMESLGTVYEGSVLDLRSPRDMLNPRVAFKENPQIPIRLELVHTAAGPIYGRKETGEPPDPALEGVLGTPDAAQMGIASHYEQHMAVRGTLIMEGKTLEIDGLGLRDHSWGPRYWQDIKPYLWFTSEFAPDFGMTGMAVWEDAKRQEARPGGIVVRGGQLSPVEAVSIEVEYEDEERVFPKAFQAQLQLGTGDTLAVQGKILLLIPLRNRREGKVTRIIESIAEYACGGYSGFGNTQTMEQYVEQVS